MTVRHVADLFDKAIQDHEHSARVHSEAAQRLRCARAKLIEDADRHLKKNVKAPTAQPKETRRG